MAASSQSHHCEVTVVLCRESIQTCDIEREVVAHRFGVWSPCRFDILQSVFMSSNNPSVVSFQSDGY